MKLPKCHVVVGSSNDPKRQIEPFEFLMTPVAKSHVNMTSHSTVLEVR